jgi:hypothetical protein
MRISGTKIPCRRIQWKRSISRLVF